MADTVVGNAIPVSGEYNSSAPTITDGKIKALQIDENGNLKVNLAVGDLGDVSAVTEYTDGDAAPANPDGPTITFNDDGTMRSVSDANPLPVTASVDPTGLATESEQQTQTSHLSDIKTAVEILDNIVSGSEAQVDVVSSALPTGAATAANQSTMIGHVDGIETLLGTIDADTSDIHTNTDTLAGAVDGTEMQVDVVGALPAGSNNIGDVDVASALPAGDNNIGNVDLASSIPAGSNNIGDVDIASALPAGSNNIGDVDIASALPAGANAIGNVGVIPRTSGGLSIFRSIDLDESEEQVKATAGQLFSVAAFNMTDAPLFLKFYNATAASVTVGSTTPVLTLVVPGNADSDGAGFIWNNDIGLAFDTAITVAATTGVADADTGAPGANECIVNIGYS